MRNNLQSILGMCSVLAIALTACQSGLFQNHITPAPSPQCVEPTLTLGAAAFRIDTVARQGGEFPEIPGRKQGIAYWVEGTTINYVFGLSPTRENLALNASLKAGDPVIIQWADCSRDDYVVASAETAASPEAALFDQSQGGVTIYVPGNPDGLIIRGERPVVMPAESPVPTAVDAIQLDLQIVEFTQPDDQTIQFKIVLVNQGARPLTLTEADIALQAPDGSERPPQSVEPGVPQTIEPGASLPLTLTFSKPQASSAVLRIFDVTFEYYF